MDRLAGYEAGVPLAIVNPNGTSSKCPKCNSKLEEN